MGIIAVEREATTCALNLVYHHRNELEWNYTMIVYHNIFGSFVVAHPEGFTSRVQSDNIGFASLAPIPFLVDLGKRLSDVPVLSASRPDRVS